MSDPLRLVACDGGERWACSLGALAMLVGGLATGVAAAVDATRPGNRDSLLAFSLETSARRHEPVVDVRTQAADGVRGHTSVAVGPGGRVLGGRCRHRPPVPPRCCPPTRGSVRLRLADRANGARGPPSRQLISPETD